MKKSDELNELAAALAKAQAQIEGAVKDNANPFFKSKYADLSSVWESIRNPLSSNGLSVVQTTDQTAEGIVIETTLMHSSGQWISGVYPVNPVKNDPQGLGSAITYARRYALAAIVGVYQVDDDGEAAHGRNFPQERRAPEKTFLEAPKKNGEYVFDFGQFRGLSVAEVEHSKLASYLDYLKKGAARDPQKVSLSMKQAMEAMEEKLSGLSGLNKIPF